MLHESMNFARGNRSWLSEGRGDPGVATIAQELPQFGKSVHYVSRNRSGVFGEGGVSGGESACGCRSEQSTTNSRCHCATTRRGNECGCDPTCGRASGWGNARRSPASLGQEGCCSGPAILSTHCPTA